MFFSSTTNVSYSISLLAPASRYSLPSSISPLSIFFSTTTATISMEKSDRETRDFLKIKSFSQLPFVRRSPPKEKCIRLFGKEFGGGGQTILITDKCSSADTATVIHNEAKEKGESGRKFECHYCCRNFPTSQALGGHQNAHKRERQHAKRTHLQSAMVHRSFPDAQLYRLMNHHHLTSTATPPYHHHSSTSSVTKYNNSIRFYGERASYTSHQTPIQGSPLALRRSPTAVQSSTTFNHGGLMNSSIVGSGSWSRYMHESKPIFHDQVSLDLHL